MSAPRLTARSSVVTARAQDLVLHGIIREDRACRGKVAYHSQADARHAAKFVARKLDREMTVYACPFCSEWHMAKLRHGEADDMGEDAA